MLWCVLFNYIILCCVGVHWAVLCRVLYGLVVLGLCRVVLCLYMVGYSVVCHGVV